jgi:hypothetical protein
MPPKFTPRAPQVGRYWPGKPLKDEAESSSDEDDEEDEEEMEEQPQEPPKEVNNNTSAKLITTMKTTTLSEQGPYAAPEEESSESESEDEELNQPEKRTSKVRQAHRRAIGEFHAVDQVDLEEEEEVRPLYVKQLIPSRVKSPKRKMSLARKSYFLDAHYCVQLLYPSIYPSYFYLTPTGVNATSLVVRAILLGLPTMV